MEESHTQENPIRMTQLLQKGGFGGCILWWERWHCYYAWP